MLAICDSSISNRELKHDDEQVNRVDNVVKRISNRELKLLAHARERRNAVLIAHLK